jgi:hypothetical protein
MSIQYVASQIASVDSEIHSIENKIHSIDSNISRKQKELSSIIDKISREKDIKRVANHFKEQARKNEEITRLEKDKSTKTKYLADKQKKRNDLQVQLSKEEQKEREQTKRDQKEILSIQQEISREMQRQKTLSLQFTETIKPIQEKREYDVFISHASEDKEDFVRLFANELKSKGLRVWYDEFELRIGDSLRRSIDNGLSGSRYGIVVLSVAFFNKEWPQRELDGLFAKEVNGEKVILPIWHKISKDEVMKYSPMIADMLALNTTSFTIDEITTKITERILSK